MTLIGAVDTCGLRTTMSFEYGASPSLGLPELATIVPESESGNTVGITLSTGPYLSPGTTYYYRVVASNVDGVSYGEVKTFTTEAHPSTSAPAPFPLPSIPKSTPITVSKPKSTSSVSISNKKASSKAEKLVKALKACAKKPKSKRAVCRRKAGEQFSPEENRGDRWK